MKNSSSQPDNNPADQDALFPDLRAQRHDSPYESPLTELPIIDAQSSITGVVLQYRQYLILSEHTQHTVDCFLSDLRLLSRFLGPATPVGKVSRERIVDWLMHLRWGSEERPAPKTMARRVTFLKSFFGWLAENHVIPDNIAAAIAFARPLPPLPELLHEDELARLVQAARDEIRTTLLVTLALDGGLKKEEILALTVGRIDLSDREHPRLQVKAPDVTRTQRERVIEMPPSFTAIYERYAHTFHPQDAVIACTDRNLTYLLAKAVKRAGIHKRVTLQLLRDCFAVRQLQSGLSLPELRVKLGLSDEAWYESQEKYRKLAFPV